MVLAAVVVGYFVFAAAGDVFLSHRLDRDERRLEGELRELELQHRQLEAIRDYLQTDAYIEGVARRVLGLVRPGETLVVVESTAPATPPLEQPPDDGEHRRWWEELYVPAD